MIEVSTSKAIQEVTKFYSGLTRPQINGAVNRALNHTIAIGRTAASKEIRQLYKIKAKYLGQKGPDDRENRNSALKVRKSTTSTLQAAINATGRPLPLIAFPARKTSKGITIQIIPGQTKNLPGAFFATMKSGHKGIFARGRYGTGQFKSRRKRIRPWPQNDLEITELTTTSIPHAFMIKTVTDRTIGTLNERFKKRFEHEIGRLFK